MKSSFCIDLQRFMLIPTKFPLSHSLFGFIACHFLQRRERICHLWFVQTVESHTLVIGWASHRWQTLLKKMTGVYMVYV